MGEIEIVCLYSSIGYPVVTLGFGFKSYVGYRMKQRRQKEIQKENETYYSLLREVSLQLAVCSEKVPCLTMSPCQALPPGPAREDAFNPHPSPKPGSVEERISVKEGGLPLPLANGATADNLVDKCNRSVSHRHLTILGKGAFKILLLIINGQLKIFEDNHLNLRWIFHF